MPVKSFWDLFLILFSTKYQQLTLPCTTRPSNCILHLFSPVVTSKIPDGQSIFQAQESTTLLVGYCRWCNVMKKKAQFGLIGSLSLIKITCVSYCIHNNQWARKFTKSFKHNIFRTIFRLLGARLLIYSLGSGFFEQ